MSLGPFIICLTLSLFSCVKVRSSPTWPSDLEIYNKSNKPSCKHVVIILEHTVIILSRPADIVGHPVNILGTPCKCSETTLKVWEANEEDKIDKFTSIVMLTRLTLKSDVI